MDIKGKIVVVTGAGGSFCAGGDVRDGSGRRPDGTRPSGAERVDHLRQISQLSVTLREAPIITIARKISLDTERGFALRSTSAAGVPAEGVFSVMVRSFLPPRMRPV